MMNIAKIAEGFRAFRATVKSERQHPLDLEVEESNDFFLDSMIRYGVIQDRDNFSLMSIARYWYDRGYDDGAEEC